MINELISAVERAEQNALMDENGNTLDELGPCEAYRSFNDPTGENAQPCGRDGVYRPKHDLILCAWCNRGLK